MPDEPDPPETAAWSAQDDPSAPGQASAPFRSPLAVGQRWKNYQIGDQIETDTGWCYHAVDVGMLEDVEIRVLPHDGQTAMRAQTWRELQSLEMPGLLKGSEAFDEGDNRYEVSHQLPKTTLREWTSGRPASVDDVQSLVQQISDVLIAMHDRGVVHLNLGPDTIIILSEEAGLHVALGGLEHATVYNQPELIPMPVDPLYAPPEAAGLAKHTPGAGLRAWDWWSLGRIIQEFMLGRHVLSLVVNRDVSVASPEIRARAETLLLERDPQAPRAGAVELMPPMSQRLTDLLRGLLTSSRGGRWGTDEVLRWLKQQPVKDRYQLGRNEELFAWKDRVFTVEEAAEYFSGEENWADGVTNLFDTDDSLTLVSFVGDRPEHCEVRARIDELHKFMLIPAWGGLPDGVLRDAVASAAWLLIGGEDAKLTLFGHPVDAACIKELFARGNVADGVPMVKAITALPYIQMIEQADHEAARLLSMLAATMSGEAVTKAVNEGWLDLSNAADYARMLLLAMESDRKLMELRTVLQGRFAGSRDEHIQRLFAQPKLKQTELALLAFTAAQPERYAYVSHVDWNRERCETLTQRGTRLATALFWLRLGQATRTGVVLFGPWPVVLGIWITVAFVACWPAHLRQLPWWVLATVSAAAAVRYIVAVALRASVRRHATGARPWGFLTRPARCKDEARDALGVEIVSSTASVIAMEFATVNAEVAKLVLTPPPRPLPPPGGALPAWTGTLTAWTALVAVIIAGHWHPDRPAAPTIDPTSAAAAAIEKAMTADPAAEILTPEDFFFDNPNQPRARWAVVKPAQAPALSVAGVKSASPDDVAAALIDGQRLLLPYAHGSVNALIAVSVPGIDGSGLMLYDGRNHRVVGRQVLRPSQLPSDQSWFELGKVKIFYAGVPAASPPPAPKAAVDPQKPVDTSDLPERDVRRGAYQAAPPGDEQKPTNAQPLSDALDTMNP